MDNGLNLSEVINLIMSNPELMESIKSMSKKITDAPADEGSEVKASVEAPKKEDFSKAEEESVSTYSPEGGKEPFGRKRRRELLCALKPYLSKDRANAIDSMLVITDVLDVMRRG